MDTNAVPLTATKLIARPDAKGRITLGALAKGVSSFRVFREESSGRIVLEPFVEIPAREAWLFRNAAALSQVQQGIEQSAEGRVQSLGSFSQHLEDDE
ncbi:MAG: hypothetical protein KAI47_21555 [Deltaproteobacteria bacterium]|nr:hypothetical protein [Deltaproteobacteria bacterium]